jgi:uncharacterized protein
MKFVLDTNVLFSGILTPQGPCGRIINFLLAGKIDICIDDRILLEYDDVLHKYSLPESEVKEILGFISLKAEYIAPFPVLEPFPDSTDLPFIEVALTAEAVLVTGNKRHFPEKLCRSLKVVTPREMLVLIDQ